MVGLRARVLDEEGRISDGGGGAGDEASDGHCPEKKAKRRSRLGTAVRFFILRIRIIKVMNGI